MGGLLVAGPAGLGALVDAALNHLHIGHDELDINDLNVTQGVCGALHMDDVGVVEAADHVNDGVGGPDVG